MFTQGTQSSIQRATKIYSFVTFALAFSFVLPANRRQVCVKLNFVLIFNRLLRMYHINTCALEHLNTTHQYPYFSFHNFFKLLRISISRALLPGSKNLVPLILSGKNSWSTKFPSNEWAYL